MLMGDPSAATKLDLAKVSKEELLALVVNLRGRRLYDGVNYRAAKQKKSQSQAKPRKPRATSKVKQDLLTEIEKLTKELGLELTPTQLLALSKKKKAKK